MTKLSEIEGIGPVYSQKLQDAGIRSLEALLEKGGTSKGRMEIEAKTGIGGEYILDWVNRADLFRVKGIGSEYSDLLEASGVDTVVELAARNVANLHATMLEVNAKKKLVRRPPSANMVAEWVAFAKKLPRAVSH